MKQYNTNELEQLFKTLNELIDNHAHRDNFQSGNRIFNLFKEVQRILNYKEISYDNTRSEPLKKQLALEMNYIKEQMDPLVKKTLDLKKKGLIL
jgi:hypothetical protein